jgi:DNA-binding GntR family transcriptional regulator
MKAVRQESDRLADAVYERVKADIFEFRLIPGARFSENELAARARVSRTPVREALLRLSREGFLEVHPKSGWSVRALDFARFEHLYDVRVILELAAARKLASGDFGDALAPLKKAWLVPQKQRLTDWIEVARLDEAFHATLVSATGNPELARLHADVSERIRIVRRLDFTQAERIASTYEEHGAILKAILARKPQQATLLLQSHIEQSKLEVRKISIHRLHEAHEAARRSA